MEGGGRGCMGEGEERRWRRWGGGGRGEWMEKDICIEWAQGTVAVGSGMMIGVMLPVHGVDRVRSITARFRAGS